MRYFSLFFLLFFFSSFFSPLSSENKEGIFIAPVENIVSYNSWWLYVFDAEVIFDSQRTGFYFSFSPDDFINNDIQVIWRTKKWNYQRTIDNDGDLPNKSLSQGFSEPFITTPIDAIGFSIISQRKLSLDTIKLWTSYSKSNKVSLDGAYASPRIVSRSEWGADESYRYADNDLQSGKYNEYLKYRQSKKTQSQIDAITLSNKRQEQLDSLFPETQKLIVVRRYENGHRLVWPIEKTKQVDKIVLHHTAETLDTDASDETYLKEIYKYHAIARGWWDIGYNYIIWQRWTIYEGRAWWDYVVGWHVPANNRWTVGISVIGNFELYTVNKDQQQWIIDAIGYIAEKYGINLSQKSKAVYSCTWWDCSSIQTHDVFMLSWHRDYNPTACPWKNLYDIIPNLRKTFSWKTYLPVYNTEYFMDNLPEDEVMNMSLKETESSSSIRISNDNQKKITKVRYLGQKFKLKLSYPEKEFIDISSYTKSSINMLMGRNKIIVPAWSSIKVWIVWNSKLEVKLWEKTYNTDTIRISWNILRIDSWNRVPAWDTRKIYNDNLFRDTLSLYNDNWKILVVNELPLEWYLKWIWEVSNGDPEEKIKTIVVAARTYARYYMDRSHRKYNTQLYDGSDDPDSFQKYLGYSYEVRSPNTSKIVDATRWEMIYYNDILIKPWYFSSSDGRTLSYRNYCELNNPWSTCQDIPYLQSVDDPAWVWKVRSGHGVGISGIGATYAANLWKTYKEIIAYYLKWVEIKKK